MANNRRLVFIISIFALMAWISISFSSPFNSGIATGLKANGDFKPSSSWSSALQVIIPSTNYAKASFKTPQRAIMTKMVNETLRAKLGRSAWHLLHTMSAKFPPFPTTEEQQTFLDFISLFSQLYPCGDCAQHFQSVLARHPPRVSSRSEVVQWTCEVHNIVNERLAKPIVDCKDIEKMYQCGCGDD